MFKNLARREFLKGAAGAGLAAMAANAPFSFGINEQKKQPNILWIMSDEHNPAVTGCYGNKTVKTPNIDSLAENGIVFENHYCNSPLCVPSRASLTAGKYCSRVDTWSLECELPSADIPSIPRVLNAAGYESFLCGKQHYDYSRRYGFTEVGGNFNNSYKTGRTKRLLPSETTSIRVSGRFKSFRPGPHGGSVEHDRKVTPGVVDFLSKRKASDKPFFFFTGYLTPHFPLVVPEEYWDRYKGKIDLPEIPLGFLDSLPLNYKLLRAGFQMIGVPDETVKRGRELYYGLTNWMDDEVGKVLTALRANQEIAENTIIIYSSDHGENMGEHGLWWKNSMYEQSAGVPLVISWPERWGGGQRRVGASSHLDLVQTLADIGGGHPPEDWNGTSLAPWMDNAKHQWKDFACSEYYAHNVASGYVMTRAGEWKYTYHTPADKDHPAVRELYNMKSDPKEFTNLANKPEHAQLIADLHKRMVKEVGGDPDETELRARKQLAEGYHRKDAHPDGTRGTSE